jgi:2-phosphosulfolactate phosphatase
MGATIANRYNLHMQSIRVVLLPTLLGPDDTAGRAVAVFDVLRATTTMAAAIGAGANQIDVFGSLGEASAAAKSCESLRLLAGEQQCLPPPGFDLGNSPGDFIPACCERRTLFMSTTNGTRALVAARSAARLFTGAIVNAAATARALAQTRLPITLLCAGTNGRIAMEDVIGCGAIIATIGQPLLENDEARIAQQLWLGAKGGLIEQLSSTQGGRNVIDAGLGKDIAFAGRLDVFDHACVVSDDQGRLVVTREQSYDRIT